MPMVLCKYPSCWEQAIALPCLFRPTLAEPCVGQVTERIPPEILSRVFRNVHDTCPGKDQYRFCTRLASVCRVWRDVAVQDPRLWTSIVVANPTDRELEIVRLCLLRSGSCLLDVSLGEWEYKDEDSEDIMAEICELLGFHIGRLRSIRLRSTSTRSIPLLPHGELGVPGSKIPALRVFELYQHSGVSEEMAFQWIFELRNAPALERCVWDGDVHPDISSPAASGVAWTKITRIMDDLGVFCTTLTVLRTSFTFSVESVLFLSQLESVIEIVFENCSEATDFVLPKTAFVLGTLQELSVVRCSWGAIHVLLTLFNFPALLRLDIDCCSVSLAQFNLFCERSQFRLKKLCVAIDEASALDVTVFIGILRVQMVQLEELRLEYNGLDIPVTGEQSVPDQPSLAVLSRLRVLQIVSDFSSLLDRVIFRHVCCPSITTLDVRSAGNSVRELVHMLSASGSLLKCLTLRMKGALENSAEVNAFVDCPAFRSLRHATMAVDLPGRLLSTLTVFDISQTDAAFVWPWLSSFHLSYLVVDEFTLVAFVGSRSATTRIKACQKNVITYP
ncbi:hypothetical protein VNI00_004405 [Paramarasmius palmivorus]|uniref:F-box domain-containing protein n=1 Tax=Paramarasmius palmivorus TaxID=297713 RepID=A0AAW0DN53_9AGAR